VKSLRDRRLPVLAGLCSFTMFVVFSFSSCAAQPAPAEHNADVETSAAHDSARAVTGRASAQGVRFRIETAMIPQLPSSIGAVSQGLVSRLDPTNGTALSSAFRDAYADALFRGIALVGALGGDRVHGWPLVKSGAYAQNWRSSISVPNSWGLSELALAARPLTGDRVFLVRGVLLDAYGRGEGVGSANGVIGFGAPLSDEYAFGGDLAQRFELGLIVIAEDGRRRFLSESAPSLSSAPGDGLGSLAAASSPYTAAVAAAFRSAWTAAINRGLPPADADGPVRSIALSPAEVKGALAGDPTSPVISGAVPTGPLAQADDEEKVRPEPVRVESVLIQTYGAAAWALALPVGKGIGFRARILEPPFLDFLLGEGSWEDAFVAYGPPLSDPFPKEGKTVQRFAAGWMETE
jgi:hypothetical protein